jgi:hypothetical protein
VLPIHEDGAHVLKTVRGVQGTNMVWVQVGKSTSLWFCSLTTTTVDQVNSNHT